MESEQNQPNEPKSDKSKESDSKSKKVTGVPLGVLFIVILMLALVTIGALVSIVRSTRRNARNLERQLAAQEVQIAQNKLNETKAAEEAKLALARTRQEEVLAQARNATNVLMRLENDLARVTTNATALKTSEAGRLVALHPGLLAQARRLYEVSLPALALPTDIITKLEAARRIEQQLVDAFGTTYQPAADLAVTVQNSGIWGEQELRKVADAQTLLSALVQESKVKVPRSPLTASSPTLDAAITELVQAEATQRQRAILEKTSRASTEAIETAAKTEAEKILADAKLQAEKEMAKINEERKKWEDEKRLRDATNIVESTKVQVQAKLKEDEALRIEQRRKADTPEVKAKLAPFITPGYWQMKEGQAYDKKPLSLSAIRSYGALDQTMDGLEKLATLASTPIDKVRPRLQLQGGPRSFKRNPSEIEKIKDIQQLLIELGPVLVEKNMLQP